MGCKCEYSQGTHKAEEREEWQISLKKTTGDCQQNRSLRRRSTHSLEIFKCLLESFKQWEVGDRYQPLKGQQNRQSKQKILTHCRRELCGGEVRAKPRVGDGEEWGLVRSEPPRGPLLVCSHNSQKWHLTKEKSFSSFLLLLKNDNWEMHYQYILLQGQSYCQRYFSNGANGILVTLLERLH